MRSTCPTARRAILRLATRSRPPRATASSYDAPGHAIGSSVGWSSTPRRRAASRGDGRRANGSSGSGRRGGRRGGVPMPARPPRRRRVLGVAEGRSSWPRTSSTPSSAVLAPSTAGRPDPASPAPATSAPGRRGARSTIRRTLGRRGRGLVERLVADGRLVRVGAAVRARDRRRGRPRSGLAAAMDRLEGALAVPAPPPLAEAARAAACQPPDPRARADRTDRRLEPDLAYAAATYGELKATARWPSPRRHSRPPRCATPPGRAAST